MEILVRDKENIIIIDEKESTFEVLSEIFLRNTYQTVYVTDNKKLSGIITLGNFRRNQFKGENLINHKFTSFSIQDEDKVFDFFINHEKINALPVIDEDGNIVKEFYRRMQTEKIEFDCVLSVCNSMKYMLSQYDLIYFLVSPLSDKEMEAVKKIDKSYHGHIKIVDFLSVTMLKDSHNVFICDFSSEQFRIREVLYKKWNIDYMKYDSDAIWEYEKVKSKMKYLVKLYRKVAVIGKDFFTQMLLELYPEIDVLDADKLKWDVEENCYKYIGEPSEEVECVFMAVYFSGRMLFERNKRYVPVFMFSSAIEDIYLFSQEKVNINIHGYRNKFLIETAAAEFDIYYS